MTADVDTSDRHLTPARTIRVDDATWHRVKQLAADNGETVSDILRRALHAYVAAHQPAGTARAAAGRQ